MNKSKIGYLIVMIAMFSICLICGIMGYRNINNKDEDKVNKNKVKTNNLTQLTEDEKTHINNIIISVFNDGYRHITFMENKINISNEGMVTSAAKVMYLENRLSTDKVLSEEDKESVLDEVSDIYNKTTSYVDFNINFSNEYCGVGGYNSKEGKLFETDTKASGKCELPFILFETTDIKLMNDNEYTAFVTLAFVEQLDINEPSSCEGNKISYSKTIKAYADNEFKRNIYNSKSVGCTTPEEQGTIAIYNEKDKILNVAKEANAQYKVIFTKRNDSFILKEIKKA